MSDTNDAREPAKTRTGGFDIGFRIGGSAWQQDLPSLLQWAKDNRFGAVDLGRDGSGPAAAVTEKGLKIGSVDLKEWPKMISSDKAKRADAIAVNTAYIKELAAYGPMNHFLVMIPEDSKLSPSENFGYMVESFGELTSVLEDSKANIVIEGWPGAGSLVCTPETYGEFFRICSSPAFGINFDPSHLLRMGIDPHRFLVEFVSRVYHVHGKDTAIDPERLYLYGSELMPVFGKHIPWGGNGWRYTIPGHGLSRWSDILQTLAGAGYSGVISIELEDVNFNPQPDTEAQGLIHARAFLESC